MPTEWFDLEFIGQKVEVSGTNRFWFRKVDAEPLHYLPGQFLVFDLPTGEKRADRWRSYSIANISDGSNIVEICVTFKNGGKASDYLFNEINKGDIISCKGPDGSFLLPENHDQHLVFLASGSGIVPFRCMLQNMSYNGNPYKSITLYFGVRKEKTILYREELEDWAHFVDKFTAHICFSQEEHLPKSSSELQYHLGYIHPIYLADLTKKAKLKNTHFLVCGWSIMTDEAITHLTNTLEVPKNKIQCELYG